MSRSPPHARITASLLAAPMLLAGPSLACIFSTYGIDLPGPGTTGGSTGPGPAATTGDPPTTGPVDTETTGVPTTDAADTTTTTTTTSGPDDTTSTGASDDTTTGAPAECPPQPAITLAETLAALHDDLQGPAVDVAAIPFTRYLGLTHLYNAGVCDDEIETHRHALSKLLNSLSLAPGIAVPVAIDERRLLYRIDIRAYAWDRTAVASATKLTYPDVWELLAASDPYAVAYTDEVATALADATGTDHPFLRADAVLRHGATAPLYYDILGFPLTRANLETTLGIDTAAGIANERSGAVVGKVGRAALHESQIAEQHRVVERHAFPKVSGGYWIAYDFLAPEPDNDVFTSPFEWTPDELNVTFNLPNGFQGHLIFKGDGGRRITADKMILDDPNMPDGTVRAGISCIGCHAHGIQPAEDDLRYALDQAEDPMFDPATTEQIERLYPPRAELSKQIGLDVQRFDVALTGAGVPLDLPKEPVITAYLEYDQPIDLRRAAAELWLAELDHDALLAKLATLDPDLQPLAAEGGQVARNILTARFPAAICELGLGRTAACPDP